MKTILREELWFQRAIFSRMISHEGRLRRTSRRLSVHGVDAGRGSRTWRHTYPTEEADEMLPWVGLEWSRTPAFDERLAPPGPMRPKSKPSMEVSRAELRAGKGRELLADIEGFRDA